MEREQKQILNSNKTAIKTVKKNTTKNPITTNDKSESKRPNIFYWDMLEAITRYSFAPHQQRSEVSI